jgi:FlaG/FlaF family flagellin (archaellin)
VNHRIHRPSAAIMIALLALFVALSGVGLAATGGTFILGKSNSADSATSLSAGIGNKALQVSNTSTSSGASALGLTVAAGHAPLTVNSGAGKAANLNADLLDGNNASAFVQAGGQTQLWYSPYEFKPLDDLTTITNEGTNYVGEVYVRRANTITPYSDVVLSLNAPALLFGRQMRIAALRVCYWSYQANINRTILEQSFLPLLADETDHASPSRTCYDLAPASPVNYGSDVVLWLGLTFSGSNGFVALDGVRLKLTT